MSVSDVRSAYIRVLKELAINSLITFAWPRFILVFGGPADYLLGFVVGFILLSIIDRNYAAAGMWSVIFIVYLAWQIILSTISIAWLVLQPKPDLDPGIIAVPLRVRTGIEITVLASAITLTPGTLSIELQHNENGTPMLYVHSLRIKDPDQIRATIRNGFEAMILHITGGAMP